MQTTGSEFTARVLKEKEDAAATDKILKIVKRDYLPKKNGEGKEFLLLSSDYNRQKE